MMTKNQATALAAFIHEMRTEWDAPGVMAQLAKVNHLNSWEVAHAAMRAAENPEAKSPGVIGVVGGEHWRERARVTELLHPPKRDDLCTVPGHEGYRASPCAGCHADQLAGDPVPERRPASASLAAVNAARVAGGYAAREEL